MRAGKTFTSLSLSFRGKFANTLMNKRENLCLILCLFAQADDFSFLIFGIWILNVASQSDI